MATDKGQGFCIRSSLSWVWLLVVCIFLTFLSDHLEASRPFIQKPKPTGTSAALPSGGERAPAGGWSTISHNSYSGSLQHDCVTEHNLVISQDAVSPLPDGTPAFLVEIINTCVYGCGLEDIHLHCGSFASTQLINPVLFKRIAYDDCLVNDGKILGAGSAVSFQYSNSFMYPLSLASLACNSNSTENIH